MLEAFDLLLAIAFLAGCLSVLWMILRFSVFSSLRRRGAKDRLHKPNVAEIEAKWKIKLPRALESLYGSPLVEISETYIAAPGADREHQWHIYEFIPLTSRDLSEWLKITRVPGLPIAIDGDKGTYYLPFKDLKKSGAPPVLLRLPGLKGEDVEVASSVDEFMRFEPRGRFEDTGTAER